MVHGGHILATRH